MEPPLHASSQILWQTNIPLLFWTLYYVSWRYEIVSMEIESRKILKDLPTSQILPWGNQRVQIYCKRGLYPPPPKTHLWLAHFVCCWKFANWKIWKCNIVSCFELTYKHWFLQFVMINLINYKPWFWKKYIICSSNWQLLVVEIAFIPKQLRHQYSR